MILSANDQHSMLASIPRESGDDPAGNEAIIMALAVFPARAGMIPPVPADRFPTSGIPRESGDDPLGNPPPTPSPTYSPRERG